MNLKDIKRISNELYYPIFLLESVLSHRKRKKIETVLGFLTIAGIVVSLIVYALKFFLEIPVSGLDNGKIYFASVITFSFWVILFASESFYYSYLHLDKNKSDRIFIDFDLANIIYSVSPKDITSSFFNSDIGLYVLLRCGISRDSFAVFLKNRGGVLSDDRFNLFLDEQVITWDNFVSAIYDQDKEFSDFLFKYGIQKEELLAVVDWTIEKNEAYRAEEWWWSEDSLGRIPGMGRDWSYGQPYTLEKYKRELPVISSSRYEVHSSYGVDELKKIESVLSRSRGANAVLVGNDEAGRVQIISHLAQMIKEGTVFPQLEHKIIILFDTEMFVMQNGDKARFESELLKIMLESIMAGNIILVIENFPGLVTSGKMLGSDVASIIEPYLSSPCLQIIATSDTDSFHQIIEKNVLLMQHLEKVFIKDIGSSNTVKVLENELIRFEDGKLFFTYPALVAISESAERYFSDGIMPDKAVDLLLEMVPRLKSSNKHLVEKKDVLELVKSKTGIPIGEVSGEEKNKLLNLEKILHEKIIGQDEAIVSISNAVRRSRSGVVNPKRPIGSFLFLGPTGVGKTETTKALNEVFFGDGGHIMRLDMSEYSSADSLSKLIGSFETNQAGILSTMLREHQYGVLLLDEFEKTTPEVMNLFLQILDEGFFSDNAGKKINGRNLIIIATSNAGSDMIWEAVKSGADLSGSKDSIIDNIIKQGIFKPELLNRFDGVIVFHPLNSEHLKKISKLMLDKLHKRLSENGINLVVDETLIDFVSGYGTDPKFGARPINRVIQEKIEQIIAKKIIDGSVRNGGKVILTKEELSAQK